jgi:hypothetical protein
VDGWRIGTHLAVLFGVAGETFACFTVSPLSCVLMTGSAAMHAVFVGSAARRAEQEDPAAATVRDLSR